MEIVRRQRPADPGDDGFDLFEVDSRLWDEVLLRVVGDTDLGQGPLQRWADGDPNPYVHHEYLVALEGTSILGVALLELPQLDNRDVVYLSVAVEPAARRSGVGSALLQAVADRAKELGRQTLQAWTWEARRDPAEGGLRAREGDGTVDPQSTSATFLLHRGFSLAQVDLMSRLRIPDRNQLLQLMGESVDRMGEEYELVAWHGPTPPEFATDLARLMTTMSTDVPIGEGTLEAEVYDDARIRSNDARIELAGLQQFVTVVRHKPTDAVAGFTRIAVAADRPEVGSQWDTLVVGNHRGSGLGMALKVRNLLEVTSALPQVRRIVTGNASENSSMLRINTRLGFVPVAASGWFERRDPGDGAH